MEYLDPITRAIINNIKSSFNGHGCLYWISIGWIILIFKIGILFFWFFSLGIIATLVSIIFRYLFSDSKKDQVQSMDLTSTELNPAENNISIGILKDFTIIAVKTTGFNYYRDEIIEIAAIKVRNLEIEDTYETLCKTKIKINNFDMHGLTNKDIESYKNAKEYSKDIMTFIGNDVIMAYNAYFDITFLYNLLETNPPNKIIDLLALAKENDERNSYNLTSIKRELGINRSSYRAIDECKTSLDYYKYLVNTDKLNTIRYMPYKNVSQNS